MYLQYFIINRGDLSKKRYIWLNKNYAKNAVKFLDILVLKIISSKKKNYSLLYELVCAVWYVKVSKNKCYSLYMADKCVLLVFSIKSMDKRNNHTKTPHNLLPKI